MWWVISISEYPSFQHGGDELYRIAYIKHQRFLAATHSRNTGGLLQNRPKVRVLGKGLVVVKAAGWVVDSRELV